MSLRCWGGRSDLVLSLTGQRKGCWQIYLLHNYAWGCPRTFEKYFHPPHASCKVSRCSDLGGTDLSHWTCSHKQSSCGLSQGPVPLLIPPPLSSHLIFLLLLSQVNSVCKKTILLSLLSSLLMKNFSGLNWLGHQIPPFLLLSLGAERAESLICWGEPCFLQVNLLIKLWVNNPWWPFFYSAWGSSTVPCQLLYKGRKAVFKPT